MHDEVAITHFVGIGGAGMSGIARILLQRGQRVSGSDLRDSRALDELRALGAEIHVGHADGNVGDAAVVVTSTAVPADNPEVVAAQADGRRLLRRADMLAEVMGDDTGILIAGTHGKTTTTSMTVVALQAAGLDPSFAIGGSLNERGTNAHAGTDAVFVAEADESDRSLLAYRPDVAVVTNVEHDHPDEFADLAAVAEVFGAFLARRSAHGPAILCADDPGSAALVDAASAPVLTYGMAPSAGVRIVSDDDRWLLRQGRDDLVAFTLAVPGEHNVRNAAAALAACIALDVDVDAAARGLGRFTGVARRFQHLGTVDDIDVIDDYAHHPTEIRATLAAARARHRGRVVLVVQPHRYSRTQALGGELGRAAAAADHVVVTDVYASNEMPMPGVSGRIVAGARVDYIPHLGEIAPRLAEMVQPGDLVLVTGAGDITHVGPALLELLESSRD
ncbi:MAG: UDP-N-acetylmuramate--L-alanine ligase [Nitriliruptoraceae bacterium]